MENKILEENVQRIQKLLIDNRENVFVEKKNFTKLCAYQNNHPEVENNDGDPEGGVSLSPSAGMIKREEDINNIIIDITENGIDKYIKYFDNVNNYIDDTISTNEMTEEELKAIQSRQKYITEISNYVGKKNISDEFIKIDKDGGFYIIDKGIIERLNETNRTNYTEQLKGSATEQDIRPNMTVIDAILVIAKEVKNTNEKIEKDNNKKVEAGKYDEIQEKIEIGGNFEIPVSQEQENEEILQDDNTIIDIGDGYGNSEPQGQGTQYDLEETNKRYDKLVEDIENDNDSNEDNTLSGENEEETEDDNEEKMQQSVRQAYQRPVEKQNSYYAQSYLEAKKQGKVANTVNTTTKGSENNNMVRNKDGSISLGNSALGLTEAGKDTFTIDYGKGGLFKKFRTGKPIQEEDLEYIEKNFTKCVINSSGYKLKQIQQIILKDDEIIINKKKMENKIQLDYGETLSDLFDFKAPQWRELSQLRGVGMTSDFMWRYAKQYNIPNTTKAIATKLFGDFKNLKVFSANGVKITRRGLEEQLSKDFEADKDMKERNTRNEFNAELSNAYPDETPRRKTIRDLQRAEYKNLSRAEQKLVRKRAVPVAIAKGIIWGVKTPFRLVGWLGRRIFGR